MTIFGIENFFHIGRKIGESDGLEILRDAVKGFGDAACYTGDCVGVAADGDGVADGVVGVVALGGKEIELFASVIVELES